MQFARHPRTIAFSLALAAVSLFVAWITNGMLSDFFVNVSASFVTVLFTVIFIDSLLERERERRYSEAFRIAKEDLKQMLSALSHELSVPFGTEDDLMKTLNLANLEKKLNNFSDSNWLEFSINLPLMVDEVSNRVSEYAKLLPPEILGKLYTLERTLKRMRVSMNAYAEDIVERHAPRKEFVEKYSKDIAAFTAAHQSLDEAIENWN